AHSCLVAFRTDEGVDQGAEPVEGRLSNVLEDGSQQLGRLSPFIALESKENRRFIGKILIDRADADAGFRGDPCRRKAVRAVLRQNLNSSLQNRSDELG